MYFARLINENKCGKLFINRRTSLQIAQDQEYIQDKKQIEQRDIIENKRLAFRRKSYTECWEGKQRSSYAQKIDAAIPQSYISQHIKDGKDRLITGQRIIKLGLLKNSQMAKSVRFNSKYSKTRVMVKNNRGSSTNITLEDKSPVKLKSIDSDSTPKKIEIKQSNQISTPSQRTQILNHPSDERLQKGNIRQAKQFNTFITKGAFKNFKDNQDKNSPKNTVMSITHKKSEDNATISLDSQNISQEKDDDSSHFSQSNSLSSNKNFESNLPNINLSQQVSINLAKDGIESKSQQKIQFQDEVVEKDNNKIKLKTQQQNNDIQQQKTIMAQEQEQEIDKQGSLMIHLKENQQIDKNSQIQNIFQDNGGNSCRSKNNTPQNQILLNKMSNFSSQIQIQKLELEQIPKNIFKSTFQSQSNRESPSSRTTPNSNTWNNTTGQLQKFNYVTNYWRFVEKIHSSSNQILQDIQIDRREQALKLTQNQITIPIVPFKKCHKKIKINFENQDPFRQSSLKYNNSQTSRGNSLNSHYTSPKQSLMVNELIYKTYESSKTPQNQDTFNKNLSQRKYNTSLSGFMQKKEQPSQQLSQINTNLDDESHLKYKILLPKKNSHLRSSSINFNNRIDQLKQSSVTPIKPMGPIQQINPIGLKNKSDLFRKQQSASSNLNIKKQRMISPFNQSKNVNNNKIYINNQSGLFKPQHKSSFTSPLNQQFS